MKLKPFIKGLLTFVPGSRLILPKKKPGGDNTASYCYDIWLKHLTLLWENGLRSIPDTVAEIGPGDSLGVGIAALLSGVNNYYALDILHYATTELNLEIFDGLVDLFKRRAKRPSKGWPDFDSYLDENLFPSHILTDKILNSALSEQRIRSIRRLISSSSNQSFAEGISFQYLVPWSDFKALEEGSVDVILSHATLEHVDDIENAYSAMYRMLKPGGFMSNQIDLSSHGLSIERNGHRKCSEFVWKIVTGKRSYLINRQPYSMHKELAETNGFTIVCDLKDHVNEGIKRTQLSRRWKNISDDDLTCIESFMQARKM